MPIKGVRLARRERTGIIERCVNKSILIVALQGCKNSVIGNETFVYRAGQTVVTGVDLPSASFVKEGSPEKPYLAIVMELDLYLLSQLAAELPSSKLYEKTLKGMASSETDPEILEAFLRLLKLLDGPAKEIEMLSPMILREIHYRLLTGPLGGSLRAVNTLGTHSLRIAQAISWLRQNYKEPLKVSQLADKANMSLSTFHRHFARVTTLSPIQYQKQLRLYEAQRLMVVEDMDATNAGYMVGYESANQFNREYKRMFGEPPLKDKKKFFAKAE